MSELQKKINQSLVWAEHQAKVDCELRGGDVSEHWASVISSQLEALTEHNRLLQLENEQLSQDKAELVEALEAMRPAHYIDGGEAAYYFDKKYGHLLEKHKCD